jgi:hypothetical protein
MKIRVLRLSTASHSSSQRHQEIMKEEAVKAQDNQAHSHLRKGNSRVALHIQRQAVPARIVTRHQHDLTVIPIHRQHQRGLLLTLLNPEDHEDRTHLFRKEVSLEMINLHISPFEN